MTAGSDCGLGGRCVDGCPWVASCRLLLPSGVLLADGGDLCRGVLRHFGEYCHLLHEFLRGGVHLRRRELLSCWQQQRGRDNGGWQSSASVPPRVADSAAACVRACALAVYGWELLSGRQLAAGAFHARPRSGLAPDVLACVRICICALPLTFCGGCRVPVLPRLGITVPKAGARRRACSARWVTSARAWPRRRRSAALETTAHRVQQRQHSAQPATTGLRRSRRTRRARARGRARPLQGTTALRAPLHRQGTRAQSDTTAPAVSRRPARAAPDITALRAALVRTVLRSVVLAPCVPALSVLLFLTPTRIVVCVAAVCVQCLAGHFCTGTTAAALRACGSVARSL